VSGNCRGGARHPRGGLAGLFGPDGGMCTASPTISCQPQAGDLREEVGGSAPVGWMPDLQGEVRNAEKLNAGRLGGRERQRLASRFYQLKQDTAYPGSTFIGRIWTGPPRNAGGVGIRTKLGSLFKVCPGWKAQQKILWAEMRKETGRWKDRWKILDLLADERCSPAVLDFFPSADVGKRVLAKVEAAVSEVSEAELREWVEGAEARELGAGGGSPPFLPTRLHGVRRRGEAISLVSFLSHTLFNFLGAHHIFLGQVWAEAKGELTTCRHCADSGQETGCI